MTKFGKGKDALADGIATRRLRLRLAALQGENRRLRAQRSLRNGESDFRQFIDASPVPLSVDDMKGTIEYLNRKFEEKFGYSHKEIPTSAAWFARAYPNPMYRRYVADQWRSYLKKGLSAGKEVRPPEVEVTCKDGSLRRVEFIGTLLGDRLLIAANDVTERERLEKQILEISDQERERIGQDLHDGLCQLLSGIKFKVTLLEQKLQPKAPAEALDARSLEGLLNGAIEQARNIARGLHPVDLEARGLMSALQELAGSVATVYGISCGCEFVSPVLVHDHLVATHLYRIAQEAINNALRHGRARRISIRLFGRRDRLVLKIQDNGSGFPARPGRKSGMGLHLMNYRARAIGASIEIVPGPAHGTVVTCRLRGMPPKDQVQSR
jgi:two-component system sensor kinase FixL